MFNVSERSVTSARKVHEKGAAELVAALDEDRELTMAELRGNYSPSHRDYCHMPSGRAKLAHPFTRPREVLMGYSVEKRVAILEKYILSAAKQSHKSGKEQEARTTRLEKKVADFAKRFQDLEKQIIDRTKFNNDILKKSKSNEDRIERRIAALEKRYEAAIKDINNVFKKIHDHITKLEKQIK